MADLWQQFHGLPKAIRDGVATPTAIVAIDDLEQKHPGLELANVVMRVVVHEFPITELEQKISAESSIDQATATIITSRLRRDVFTGVIADYLGLKVAPVAIPPTSTPATAPPKPPANLPIAPSANLSTVTTSKPTPPKVTSPPPTTITRPVQAQPPPRLAPVPVTMAMPKPTTPIGSNAPTTQYSDEDAVEIANQASKLRTLTTANPNQDLDSLAQQILIEQNVALSDELLQRRSMAILKSRFKDVRTTAETAEMLAREPKVGGLGLDREIALSLAIAAEKYAMTLKERGMVRAPVPMAVPLPPAVPSVSQARPAPMPPFRREAPPAPMSPVPVQNFTEAPRASRPIRRPVDLPVMAPLEQAPISKPITQAPSATVIQRPRGTDRPTVADVVRPQVALGPAEELRSMTLIEFRRLGQGAGDAARRLLDKFDHLQRESFTVWAEAVAGWRQSAIYELYLAMGRESMEKGLPISQIITERGRIGQPYLSEHEFIILSDLNRQLQL